VTAAALTLGCVVVFAGLALLVGVVVVGIREPRYDIDTATADHQARKAAGEVETVMAGEPEEALP
jgi:hypothetical protein